MAAINKSFVIKNGLEVSTNLIFADAPKNRVGIGTTNLLQKFQIGNVDVSGISTDGKVFVVTSDAKVGIGTTNPLEKLQVGSGSSSFFVTTVGSVGLGITNPQYKLQVIGGIGVTDSFVTGISTVLTELRVGTGGTVLTVLGVGNSIGIGTASPAFLFDIRSPVSTGQTALYVQGDVRITGDLSADDITFDDATLSNLTVTEALNVTSPGISTFGGYVDINNSVDISGTLNVVGLSTLGGYVDINNSVDISGTLNVVGLSTLGGYVDINNSVDISNNLNVTGIATIATVDINAGEIDVTRIETGNLSVTGIGTIVNGFITNLTGTAGTITTLNSTNGTITNLTGTAGTITTFNSTNSTITNLNVTGIATIATLNATGIGVTNFTVYNALSVGGISTFTNGPVLIGSGTSTGTASQRLQVTGGTYVSDNLGIGSTNPTSKLDVIGDVRVTGVITATTFIGNVNAGAGTITTLGSTNGTITNLTGTAGTITTFNSTSGTITNLTGTAGTITTFNSTSGTITNLTGTAGTITNLTGTAGTITTFNSTNSTITNLTGTNVFYSGIGTAGSLSIGSTQVISSARQLQNIASLDATTTATIEAAIANAPNTFTDLTVTGISTLGTVKISSGIITATSGIVTYYGDGQYLDLTNNLSTGIGIGTTGGVVGYGITFLDLKGAGVSTTQYNSSTGIATIFFEGGGGGGSISISTTAPLLPGSGDLWYSPDYGRTFIYYDENTVGYGTDAFWVDAAPFNVGVITSTAFAPASASAPSIHFAGDVQTGFFSPSSGNITAVSVGSSILNVNPSGVVVTGIATATDFDALSDENYKENVITVNNALNKVEQLRGVSFDWKENGRSSYGVIAQELQKVLPELVHGDNPKTVNYNGIIGVLIEAIKELKEEVEELKRG